MIENENSTRAAQVYSLDERRKIPRVKPSPPDATIRISLQARVSPQHRARQGSTDRRWRVVSDRIAALPQLRARADGSPLSGLRPRSPGSLTLSRLRSGLRKDGLSLGQNALLVIGLLAAFGLGFLAGTSSHNVPASAGIVHADQAG